MKTKILALLLALLCVALLACDGNGNKNESDIVSENESDIVSENESDVVSENEASTNSDAITEQKVIIGTDTHFNCNLEELSAHLENGCDICERLSIFIIPQVISGIIPDKGYSCPDNLKAIFEDENNKDSYVHMLVRIDTPGITLPKDVVENIRNEYNEIVKNTDNRDVKNKATVDYFDTLGEHYDEHIVSQFASIGVSAKRIVSTVYEVLMTPEQFKNLDKVEMYMVLRSCPQNITREYALEFMYQTYRAY